MRKLSLWAKIHPHAARLLIVLFYLPLNVCGILAGDLLFDFGLRFSTTFFGVVMLIFLVTVFNYPSTGKHRATYTRRKTSDLILVACTFLMICYTGNQLNNNISPKPGFIAFAGNTSQNITTSGSINLPLVRKAGPPERTSKKQLRKKWKQYVKQFRKYYKERSDGEKAALIALAVIGALFLTYVLAALSCSVACGGAEGLAYVIFFGGLFAIVFFLVKLIKRIRGGPKQPEPPEDKVSPSQRLGRT